MCRNSAGNLIIQNVQLIYYDSERNHRDSTTKYPSRSPSVTIKLLLNGILHSVTLKITYYDNSVFIDKRAITHQDLRFQLT